MRRSADDRCSPRTVRCRGRTIRWASCGMARRCSASTAATPILRSSARPASPAANATCCIPRRGQSRAITLPRTRDYDDEEWRLCEQQLAARGLIDDDGSLTTAGRELKDHVESSTDALSLSVFDALNDDELETLFQSLTPITRTVVAGGDVPAMTPMALRRNELDDNSAHLS